MEVLMAERPTQVFHNKVIDETAMKRLIIRFIDHYGIGYTSHILDQVKTLGFRQATAASISLGIDDLLTIPSKRWLSGKNKKGDRIPDYSELNRMTCTGRCNLRYPGILDGNSDLLAKRRRNRVIIPLDSIQEGENQLIPRI